MSQPVTVLIPCFNASEYLEEALKSILNQSHQDLRVLVLDDGSTDQSLTIAKRLANQDSRIEVHCNNANLGIIASRNKLLGLCKTDYAAWMDADDIAHPERLAKQLSYMQAHPDCAVCTCHYRRQGLGEERIIRIPPEHVSREYLLFYNYILNPGSMFNAALCKEHGVEFRSWISGASDFLFWVELARFGKVGVVPEMLMTYRLHPNQETLAQKQRQLKGCTEIVQYQLAQFGCHADTEDLARLLIYPADILKLDYCTSHLRSNAATVKAVLAKLPAEQFDVEKVKRLLFTLFRSQARRTGTRGFFEFVRLYGLTGLRQCHAFGAGLLTNAVKSDWHRLVKRG